MRKLVCTIYYTIDKENVVQKCVICNEIKEKQ